MAGVQVDAKSQNDKAILARDETAKALSLQKEKQDREAQLARDKALDEFNLKAECERRNCALEKETQDKKHALERERLDFERECHKEEMMAEEKIKNETGAEAIAPKLVESMQGIVKEFAEVIAGQQAFQKQLIEQLARPKKVVLSGVQRGSEGITGASATVQ